MTAMQKVAANIRTFSIRLWLLSLVGRTVAHAVAWAFSFDEVQRAFLESVDCSTPIGRMLNNQIDSRAEATFDDQIDSWSRNTGLDAEDVNNLDAAVREGVKDALDDIDAGDIKNLDEYMEESLVRYVDQVPDNLIRLIHQRLSY